MDLKINPNLSIELAEDIGNKTFLLLGHNNLDSIIPYISEMQEGLFSNRYESGDNLLYHASLVCESHNHFQEVGLGHFKTVDGKNYIVRDRPFYYIDHDNKVSKGQDLLQFFCDKSADEKLVVATYLPQTIQEVLCCPNSIIGCDSPHVPLPVSIKENSLLGRLENGIQSIDIASIFTPNNVLSVISQFTRTLKLMCSILDVNRLRTSQLELKPSKTPSAKEGSLYYDKAQKVLKFYNGAEWITLQ